MSIQHTKVSNKEMNDIIIDEIKNGRLARYDNSEVIIKIEKFDKRNFNINIKYTI